MDFKYLYAAFGALIGVGLLYGLYLDTSDSTYLILGAILGGLFGMALFSYDSWLKKRNEKIRKEKGIPEPTQKQKVKSYIIFFIVMMVVMIFIMKYF
ncbi:MAG: hypothetical protein PHP51_08965 [Desulfotomaculaceae bacterium]|nr:hypothetical protein [Desulfotomaculaceae bacterium]MDD4768143.1 hypothetical protein [Desulfotomaculaceae bacterium]